MKLSDMSVINVIVPHLLPGLMPMMEPVPIVERYARMKIQNSFGYSL